MRFYLVDRVTKFVPGEFIEGFKNVSMTEPYFTYHFQRHPIMPGVLVIEAMAQIAGLMIEMTIPEGDFKKAILSIVDRTKFKFPVRPGDRLDLRARVLNLSDNGAACETVAEVEGKLVSRTTLTFSLQSVGELYDDYLEAERKALVKILTRDLEGYGQ